MARLECFCFNKCGAGSDRKSSFDDKWTQICKGNYFYYFHISYMPQLETVFSRCALYRILFKNLNLAMMVSFSSMEWCIYEENPMGSYLSCILYTLYVGEKRKEVIASELLLSSLDDASLPNFVRTPARIEALMDRSNENVG